MIFDLVGKEFRIRTRSFQKGPEAFLRAFLQVIGVVIFVALECFLFALLDKKVQTNSPFGSYDFLALFLFIVFLLSWFAGILEARRTLYDKDDARLALSLPLEPFEIVLSKVIYLYLRLALTGLVVASPLIITYGAVRQVMPIFYLFALLYPFVVALPLVGLAVLVAPLYQRIFCFLKQHDLLQFGLASLLCVGLCFLYRYVLSLFLALLTNAEVGGLFSPAFLEGLDETVPWLIPSSPALGMLIGQVDAVVVIPVYFAASLVLIFLGVFVASLSYEKVAKREMSASAPRSKAGERRLEKPETALLKKEIHLLFRDSGFTFSYTALLVMEPFFSFLVISALKEIMWWNLRVYLVYFPELLNGLDIFLLLLFAAVISLSAASSLKREGANLLIVKHLPISPWKQLLLKAAVPLVLSYFSFFTSVLVGAIGGFYGWDIAALALLYGLALIVGLSVYGLWDDLALHGNGHPSFSWSGTLAFGLPLALLVFHLLFSFLALPRYFIYALDALVCLLFVLPLLLRRRSYYEKAFLALEVA